MNKNIEKIINVLGYKVEFDKLGMMICDNNNQELKKEIIQEYTNSSFKYTSENGKEIIISDEGYMTIKLDDNTRICVYDINCQYLCNHITIYVGPENSYAFYVSIEFYKGDNYGGISTTIRENADNDLHYANYNEDVSIQANNNGANICYLPYWSYTHLGDDKHLSIEECTTSEYYKIIFDFINKVATGYYGELIKKAFLIISPTLLGIIDEIIEICKVSENNKEKKY